jgi:predicted transcriptional regulator of viral defense system
VRLNRFVNTLRAKALYEVALQQSGHFTTQQAKTAGFKENTHPYHVKRGNWIRIHRGLYRLAVFPDSRLGQLFGWHLWSRDRKQTPLGVFSHLTALELHRLFPATGKSVFMTVPRSFRRTSRPPAVLSLYKSDLIAKDLVEIEAIRVTSVRRTLQDVAACDLLSRDQLQAVLKQALAVGLVDVQFLTGLIGDQFEFRFDK